MTTSRVVHVIVKCAFLNIANECLEGYTFSVTRLVSHQKFKHLTTFDATLTLLGMRSKTPQRLNSKVFIRKY